MLIKAVANFSGLESMNVGEIKEVDGKIAADLINAGCAVGAESKPKKKTADTANRDDKNDKRDNS